MQCNSTLIINSIYLWLSGLLHVGDIIMQVNGEVVKGDPDEVLSKLVS